MKIAMVASECVPFVKVGGLADVVGSLPKYLRARGHDVCVIIPKYRAIDEKKFNLERVPGRLVVPLGGNYEEVSLYRTNLPGTDVRVVFIDSRRYFHRNGIYHTTDGDYADNCERFIVFSRAALEALKFIDFQPDVVHCHDWQSGVIPAYLKTVYRIDGFYGRTASVYTIHNIAYQGHFDEGTVELGGFSRKDFTWDRLNFHNGFNFMKAGIVYADRISTVSPTYAREIMTETFGRGMEKVLASRSADLYGILNGIDYEEWNPRDDRYIASAFAPGEVQGKAVCKRDLQKACSLPAADVPVIGSVSRLDPQKGYDLVEKVLPLLLAGPVQIVMLGSGDRIIQEMLTLLSREFPDKLAVSFHFNEPLAHRIYAGADLFLMPSRFEPCGLGQMIALAYGTIPIVNRTGGLFDTVADFNPRTGSGNGFTFYPPGAAELKYALERALRAYRNKKEWKKLIDNAFNSRFPWDSSVGKYEELYRNSIANRRKFE